MKFICKNSDIYEYYEMYCIINIRKWGMVKEGLIK